MFVDGASVFAHLASACGVWLMLGALTDLARKSGLGSVAPGVMLRRFAGLPRSVFGTALAHFGLGLTMLGIVGTLCLRQPRSISSMKPGETVATAGYTLRFDGLSRHSGPNYTEDRGRFTLLGADGKHHRRDRLGEALLPGPADADDRGRHPDDRASASSMSRSATTARTAASSCALWWKPLVTLIWLGGLVMMAGLRCR